METILLGSLPAVTANTKQPLVLSGLFLDGYELRSLLIDIAFTIRNNAAATFLIAAADHNTLLNNFISRIRLKAWGIDDAFNLPPVVARNIAAYANGEDPARLDPKIDVGATIPAVGSAVQPTHLTVPIHFFHRGLDTPEMWAPSTNQFNVAGHRLVVELGAMTSPLALANATAQLVVGSIDIYAVLAPIDIVHFNVAHIWREIAVSNNRFPEDGKYIDLLFADERDPYTVAAQVSQITVYRDDRASPANLSPPIIAERFLQSQPIADGNRPINLVSNGLGLTGSQFTPYAWVDSSVRSTELQVEVTRKNRTLFQNLGAGGSAAATIVNWQTMPIESSLKELVKTASRHGMSFSSVNDLEVHGFGGRDNDTMADFKGRRLALRRTSTQRQVVTTPVVKQTSA